MPTIETIKASEAPGIPRKQSKMAQELLTALTNLKKDEVLKLAPDEGKSIRGLRTGIGRITSTAGVKVEAWNDDTHVYLKKV